MRNRGIDPVRLYVTLPGQWSDPVTSVKLYPTRRLARIARLVLSHKGWHTTVRRVSVVAIALCLMTLGACTRPCTSVYVDVLDSEYQLGMEQLQASQAEGYTCHAGSPILGGTQYVCTICES